VQSGVGCLYRKVLGELVGTPFHIFMSTWGMRGNLRADFGGIVIYSVSLMFMVCWSIVFIVHLHMTCLKRYFFFDKSVFVVNALLFPTTYKTYF